MKFHFPLIDAVASAVTDIFQTGYYADKVIERVLKSNPKMGSNDRAFVAETTYNIVRWWRLLNDSAGTEYQTDRKSILTIISAYFFLFHEERAQWKENYGVDFDQIRARYEELKKNRAFIQSIPDWMDEKGVKELGEKWNAELEALNKEANVTLRVNTLRISRKALQEKLREEHLDTEPGKVSHDALVLTKRKNVFRSESFLEGLFEIQDEGSQCIAQFLQVEPGMRVIDACAGAGGKTLHLAALLKEKGQLIALDVVPRKLDELKRRAKRNGVLNIDTRLIESSKTIKRLAESADRLLLDVPCSGLGTLRRNPDAKWKLKPEFLEEVKKTQAEILESYSRMLKPGGKMVYATCSIFPSENEQQVQEFLARHPEFQLENEQHLFPSQGNTDGFYMALMSKKVTPNS